METTKTVAELIKAYVNEHLHDPITASDIAKAAGYSQYHARRLGAATTIIPRRGTYSAESRKPYMSR
ncbi:MAG: hypothetical protein LBC86_09785 [Oscillospiraceae bacterium]|jgi:AraC-like DNA-binding protein|nr:hypothetical protein [Oscillospiraceae bacterium]